jgi:hypothetical protein
MFPPDVDQCCAYRGVATHAWYVLTLHHGRFVYVGGNDEYALAMAATTARLKGWIL